MAVQSINKTSFASEVLEHKGKVLVDFYAEWCGPCKITAPIIEELSNDPKYKNTIKFTKVNVDSEQDLASTYGVLSIPTFIIFDNGKIISQFVGAHDKAGFESELNK